MFNFSTLHWSTGILFLLCGTLYGAKRVITTRSFDSDLFMDIISRYKITTTFLVPYAISLLLKNSNLKPLETVTNMLAGGSVVSKKLCEAMAPYLLKCKLTTAYGSTESDSLTSSATHQRYGSVGKVFFNVQIKIIDEVENKLGPNETGEICYKTPIAFTEYLGDPEKTKEAIKNGWVYTGDIGYFDIDGFLFVIDRKKDMLKVNNFQVSSIFKPLRFYILNFTFITRQVYPSELEALINKIDGVVNSCVVGVYEEEKGNDLIFAFVIKDTSNQHVTAEGILKYVHSRTTFVNQLSGGVYFLDSFPLTPSGKVRKTEVKNIAKSLLNFDTS